MPLLLNGTPTSLPVSQPVVPGTLRVPEWWPESEMRSMAVDFMADALEGPLWFVIVLEIGWHNGRVFGSSCRSGGCVNCFLNWAIIRFELVL